MNLRIPCALLLSVLLAGCSSSGDGSAVPPSESAPASTSSSASGSPEAPPDDAFTYGGVTVVGGPGEEPSVTLGDDFGPATELAAVDITEGTGDPVADGDVVAVHYVGVGEQSREVFDSSWPAGAPVTFPLAVVIQGWQEGMVGMKQGGRRLLIIPGSLAYGPDGRAPVIGPDETLVFVVDLVDIPS